MDFITKLKLTRHTSRRLDKSVYYEENYRALPDDIFEDDEFESFSRFIL